MPRGIYPRTKKQLRILRNGGKIGRRVASSLPRTAEQLRASRKNIELSRDHYPFEARRTEKARILAAKILKRTHQEKNGRCDICGIRCFALQDHCHKTGKLRGRLCHKCNMGLGLFQDNPGLLRNAVSYLESHTIKRFPRLAA